MNRVLSQPLHVKKKTERCNFILLPTNNYVQSSRAVHIVQTKTGEQRIGKSFRQISTVRSAYRYVLYCIKDIVCYTCRMKSKFKTTAQAFY